MNKTRRALQGGRRRSPFFFNSPGPGEMQAITRQMGGRKFDPSVVAAVGKRCPHGFPSVVVCLPLKKGKPFPTTFWLTCPHLVKLCAVAESKGQVPQMEEWLRERPRQWTEYNLLHGKLRLLMLSPAAARAIRKGGKSFWDSLRLGGVGGIKYLPPFQGGVKCLHLQTASWLALGFHPGEDFLQNTISSFACADPAGEVCSPKRTKNL